MGHPVEGLRRTARRAGAQRLVPRRRRRSKVRRGKTPVQLPCVVYSDAVTRLVQALYDLGAIVPFDWPNWHGPNRYREGHAPHDASVADDADDPLSSAPTGSSRALSLPQSTTEPSRRALRRVWIRLASRSRQEHALPDRLPAPSVGHRLLYRQESPPCTADCRRRHRSHGNPLAEDRPRATPRRALLPHGGGVRAP